MSQSLRGRAVLAVLVLMIGVGRAEAQPQPQPQPQPKPGRAPDVKAQLEAIKVELAELRTMAVQAPTVAQSVQELTARVTALETELAELKRAQAAGPEVVASLDGLAGKVDELEREVEALRTQLSGMESPSAASGGGAVVWKGGFGWESADGDYTLKLGGYVQPRLEVELPETFDSITTSTFRLRRARLVAQGHLGGEALSYKLQAELGKEEPPALDYYLDYQFAPELAVRAGQQKVPFTRAWQVSDSGYDYFERAAAIDTLRYDRDAGVWLHGRVADRLEYQVGASNGAGPNRKNDNIDVAAVARLDVLVMGEWFEWLTGDLEHSEVPSLIVGAGGVHDLVRVPEMVAGVMVENPDVDADGTGDNVRVWSSSLDAIFRYRGFEALVEALWRHERWGTILDHSDNQALADLVRPDRDGHRNYLAGFLEATYAAIPHHLLLGGRVGHSRVPLLGLGGLEVKGPPPGDRLLEVTALARYFHSKNLSFGLQYSLFDYRATTGPNPVDDKRHLFIAQSQLNF
jgi:outer membrane murein-binding lipoprotein Lpp